MRAVTEDHPGSLVRKAREALDLSQDAFAARAQMTSRTVLSNIERGKNQLSTADQQEAVARGFGVSADDLKKLLAGTMSVEEFVDKARAAGSSGTFPVASPAAPTSERYVVLDDAYPGRAEAIALVGDQYPENVVRSVQQKRLKDGEEDKGREYWLEQLLDAHRSFLRWQRTIEDVTSRDGAADQDEARPTVGSDQLKALAAEKKRGKK